MKSEPFNEVELELATVLDGIVASYRLRMLDELRVRLGEVSSESEHQKGVGGGRGGNKRMMKLEMILLLVSSCLRFPVFPKSQA